MVDLRSVRRSQRSTLDPKELQRIITMRDKRFTLMSIASLLALALTNLRLTHKAISLGLLKHLQPPLPMKRYQ